MLTVCVVAKDSRLHLLMLAAAWNNIDVAKDAMFSEDIPWQVWYSSVFCLCEFYKSLYTQEIFGYERECAQQPNM